MLIYVILKTFVADSEYPSLPELPEIQLVQKENATANGTGDFSIFFLKCEVSTATETNVEYELQWLISGAVSKTNTFTSSDATGGKFESVLSGESLKSFQKIDQVSELFRTYIECIDYYFIFQCVFLLLEKMQL